MLHRLCAAVRGNSGESLLHRAAAAGADDLARAILETEFDANDRDAQAKTPLMEAATYGHASTARILLERSAGHSPIEHTRLHLSCMLPHATMQMWCSF